MIDNSDLEFECFRDDITGDYTGKLTKDGKVVHENRIKADVDISGYDPCAILEKEAKEEYDRNKK